MYWFYTETVERIELGGVYLKEIKSIWENPFYITKYRTRETSPYSIQLVYMI